MQSQPQTLTVKAARHSSIYPSGFSRPNRSMGRFCCALLICAAVSFTAPGFAQSTAPSNKESEAMARAIREASSPLRIIFESSKLKNKGTDRKPNTAPAQSAAADPSPAPVTPPPRTPTATASPRTARAKPAEADNQPKAQSVAPRVSESTPSNAAPATHTATTISTAQPSVNVAAPPVPAAALEPEIQPPKRRKLLSMVEPDIPRSVLYRLGQFDEVMVEVKIRPDGSVSSVAVQPPAPKILERYLISAVQKWQFEPADADSSMLLQLVVSPR